MLKVAMAIPTQMESNCKDIAVYVVLKTKFKERILFCKRRRVSRWQGFAHRSLEMRYFVVASGTETEKARA
jgi:hypothetical protein